MTTLGVIFPPDLPPEDLHEVALTADDAGVEELWLWEDCFAESGLAPAAAVLAWTRRIRVGIGLLPVPLRNVALTAMELATLARLFPGRTVPGIGHGVLEWMGQVGARASSPMTLLDEYSAALRRLLHGEVVSVSGRYVQLADVALAWPPRPAPPLLIGAVGPRTVRLAGARGDGVILTESAGVAGVRTAVSSLNPAPGFAVVAFATVRNAPRPAEVAALVGEHVAAGATTVALRSVGDARPPLAEFAAFIGREVRPLVEQGAAGG
jgi:alkanesulfonate monooxygenase SsuD/methylene tetrahydromethanopterin reductase-like flavin-dependent oxidoreductase (luciferase family)